MNFFVILSPCNLKIKRKIKWNGIYVLTNSKLKSKMKMCEKIYSMIWNFFDNSNRNVIELNVSCCLQYIIKWEKKKKWKQMNSLKSVFHIHKTHTHKIYLLKFKKSLTFFYLYKNKYIEIPFMNFDLERKKQFFFLFFCLIRINIYKVYRIYRITGLC